MCHDLPGSGMQRKQKHFLDLKQICNARKAVLHLFFLLVSLFGPWHIPASSLLWSLPSMLTLGGRKCELYTSNTGVLGWNGDSSTKRDLSETEFSN